MPQTSGYLRHFLACNKHDITRFTPFLIAGKRYGYVPNALAAVLPQETGVFVTTADGVALDPTLETFAARSAALHQATEWIAAHYGKKLRHELYPVIENWGDVPVAQVDRAASAWLGVKARGVHVNGFVRKPDGIHLWIGERAANRPAYPGQLDNLIGGGQPIGLSIEENLCKEAQEEAGIAPALASTATFVCELHYRFERDEGLWNHTLLIYDLELPESFTPRNTDGEVAAFHLLPLPEVAALVRDTDRFKLNCNLVIIDFLLRYGVITAQDTEYAKLQPYLM